MESFFKRLTVMIFVLNFYFRGVFVCLGLVSQLKIYSTIRKLTEFVLQEFWDEVKGYSYKMKDESRILQIL